MPQVDFPTINVQASLPGGSPEVMAASIATPLEKQFTRIAGVTEMTSRSSVGSAQVTLQFDLSRDINAAGRDVQAAINAAAGYLPSNLPSKPRYRKINPADQPILILALTSNVVPRPQLYDTASSVFAQKLAQIPGVGQVSVAGSSLPAVRVEVNPQPISKYNVGLDQISSFLAGRQRQQCQRVSQQLPERPCRSWSRTSCCKPSDYRDLVVVFRNGAPVRLSDLGRVVDSVEDVRNLGLANGIPAVLIQISRQPNANIIDTVDRIKAILPQFKATLPPTVDFNDPERPHDNHPRVRAGRPVEHADVDRPRDLRGVRFPAQWMGNIHPEHLGAGFAGGHVRRHVLLGYNLDNLSLMGLTIATGFVVDDAIVVIENITRHIENGVPPMQAALRERGKSASRCSR